jgi:Outer membrane protein beta-barrel domain
MKKLLFFIPLFLSLTGLAQIRLELMGGYNDVNLSTVGKLPFSANHFPEGEYVPISSFHAGAATTIALGKKWALEPGLLYFGNGAHLNAAYLNPGNSSFVNETIHLYYLRLPVNVLYKIVTAGPFHVFAGAGLYVARGIRGNEKGQELDEGPVQFPTLAINDKVRFGNQPSPDGTYLAATAYDFGYTILAGIGWKNFQLRPSISNGFIKVFPGSDKLYNSAVAVSLVYQL